MSAARFTPGPWEWRWDHDADLIAAAPALYEALEAAAPHVCSLLCPTVKKTGDEWAHVAECQQIQRALAAARGDTPS